MKTLTDVVVAVSVVAGVFCTRPGVSLCCCAKVQSTCLHQQQKSSSSSASSTAGIVTGVSVAVVACSSRQFRQCGADVPCVAVLLQTGVLSPYPVALLAADAPSPPVILSPIGEKKKKTPVVVAASAPSELILTAGFELMRSPYTPSLLTFFRDRVRYRIFFHAVILSATSATSY